MRYFEEPSNKLPVAAEADVVVVGGGPAGVAAAVAAARLGARTCLVEKMACFGGMWTSALVLTLGGYNSWLKPYRRIVAGIGGEWLARAAELGGARDNEGWVVDSDPEIMKLVADELVTGAGVNCFLHCWGAKPIMSGNQVAGVICESVSGRQAFLAHITVDCTGNGDIAARAGAHFAQSVSLQPMTLPFRLGGVRTDPGVDHTAPRVVPIGPEPGSLSVELLKGTFGRKDIDVDRAKLDADCARGLIPRFGGPWFGGMDKEIVWLNTVRVYGDATDVAELTKAEIQGRQDAHALTSYLISHFDEFAQAKLLETASQIGVRETRRILGLATLTGDHIRQNVKFADSIAVGGWPIDIHPAPGHVGGHVMFVPAPYGIPYGCLLPQDLSGILVAGRCISADREALGSLRVGATCAALGHAAGVAAALAAAKGRSPAELNCEEVQAALLRQNAIIAP